ncbi:MAG: hypothetical protein WD043_07625 [Gemmatimonadales bacterium]
MLAAGAQRIHAQQADVRTLTPGDGGIDGRRIQAYTNAWQTYRVGTDGRRTPGPVWYDTVSVVRRAGTDMLRRVQVIVDSTRQTVLVNEAERAGFRPRLTTAAIRGSEPFLELHFDGARVSGKRQVLPRNGRPQDQVSAEFTLALPQPVFDWRWWGLLAAAQPLEANYASRFLTFAAESMVESFLMWITMRVVGEEAVGDIPCWVVALDAGAPWTLWIAKRGEVAPVQRIRIVQGDGTTMFWEPISVR